MNTRTRFAVAIATGLVAATAAANPPLESLRAEHPDCLVLRGEKGDITRLFGTKFAFGASPVQTATTFLDAHAAIWGVTLDDLAPVGPFEDGRHEQPMMYDRQTGEYRFTGVYFTQTRFGVPVYGSRLTILVRNEPGHPAVLATARIADAGVVRNWDGGVLGAPDEAFAVAGARRFLAAEAALDGPLRHVIFAGEAGDPRPARLAIETIARVGDPWDGDAYQRWRLFVDAATGDVLHEENLVLNYSPEGAGGGGNVSGTVIGMATEGPAADECGPESVIGLPYARISDGFTEIYADVDGKFDIDAPGEVTLSSEVRGRWFRVFNQQTAESYLEQTVTPPASVTFTHNEANDDARMRAEVNAYLEANRIRDYVLSVNPLYPAITSQTEFTVRVNINNDCNAFYNGDSINFYRALGSCNNTAFGTVVHHEYGHHLVNMGGSGQGAYGEGMSDVMGILMTGESLTGRGFHAGACGNGIRNADNNCQLTSNCSTCGTQIHACGRLISGVVWDLKSHLESTLPAEEAFEVLGDLVINSILLHDGSKIDEEIAIDYLTLDDDDGDYRNGTPHYDAIEFGFETEHGIDVPNIQFLLVSFPNGRPFQLEPAGGTTVRVLLEDFLEELEADTPTLHLVAGVETMSIQMVEQAPGDFLGTFPAMPCGTTVQWYVSAETTLGTPVFAPVGAPADTYESAYTDGFSLALNDNFQNDLGWTVSGDATTGAWERGLPTDDGPPYRPEEDGDGSGLAYGTQWGHEDDSDLDGTTILTSPVLEVAEGGTIRWFYWLDHDGDDPAGPEDGMRIEIATDVDGTEWNVLRTYDTYLNTWRSDTLVVGAGREVEPSPTIRLRVVADDLAPDNTVEAAFDGVLALSYTCECLGDLDEDGEIGFADLLILLNAWGPCAACPEDLDEGGAVDFQDLLLMLVSWGACD